MSIYTLTATLAGDTELVSIDAPNEMEATMDAITFILDSAHEDKEGAWAKGSIELTAPDGTVIQTMEAKS